MTFRFAFLRLFFRMLSTAILERLKMWDEEDTLFYAGVVALGAGLCLISLTAGLIGTGLTLLLSVRSLWRWLK